MSVERVVTPAMLALLLAAAAVPLAAADECDPYPIGRCGAYDRETAIFCYRSNMPLGVYVSATETNVITVEAPRPPDGVPLPGPFGRDAAHVLKTPADRFLDEPGPQAVPFGTLWRETNAVNGLQVVRFKCGSFIWFEYSEQWMGPFSVVNKLPDDDVA